MKNLQRLLSFIICVISLGLTIPQQSLAQELVYRPKNPAFGGSALNYQWLLSSANAQNLYNGKNGYSYKRDPLGDFQESLQRQVLSELTRNLVRDKFGENLDLSQQNSLEFGEFSIDITPGIDGVTIRIFNILTGDETSITIPNIDG